MINIGSFKIAVRFGMALAWSTLFVTGLPRAADAQAEQPLKMAQAPMPANTPAPPKPAPLTQLVFFDYEKATVGEFASGILDKIAAHAKDVSAKEVYIVAHTDSAEPNNDALSLARATGLRSALITKGVPAHKIAIVGAGAAQQLVPTAQGAKEPQNRRASITVYP